MSLNRRIKIRGINAMMVLLVFLMTGVAALVNAQNAFDYHGTHHPINQAANTSKKINLLENVNVSAVATRLNGAINSGYDEIKPALTPCGKRLYFSRHMHPSNTVGAQDMEDIWFSDYDEETNTWSDPALLNGHLNNHGPNFINNVSTTGDTVILGNQYKKNGKMRAGISYSVNVNGQWSFPAPINIKNDYNISDQGNSFVSVKTGVIIRAIQRVETEGQRDLYVSFWNGVEATEPINMGNVINTAMEESAPFLAADNKTLYFVSKGHAGYGGYDIFVTRRLDETWTNWSTPENLGPAINGPLDDEFFSITHCGNYAIFSKQVSVHNTDLFRISLEELMNKNINTRVKFREKAIIALASL